MDEYTQTTQEERPVTARKRRRPTWQRTLLKYWPTIRFALIVLNLLAVIVFLLSLLFV